MRKMFSSYQAWLSILILISIWIVLSVDLDFLPLIPSSFSKEFTLKINQLFAALSYSIIAAFVFYYFTFILPRRLTIYRSKKILAQQVHWFLYELFVLINHVLNAYDINKGIDEIEEKDLLHLDGNRLKTIDGYYRTSEHWKKGRKKGKQFTGFANMKFTYPEIIVEKLNKISELISNIRNSNPNFHVDETFAEILSSIETNRIIQWYSNKKVDMFEYSGSSGELHLLILDYFRLLKMKYHVHFYNSYHKIHFYSDEEIAAVPKKKDELFNKISPIFNNSMLLKPCIVYNADYNDSRSIISILNEGAITKVKSTSEGVILVGEAEKQFLLSEFEGEITSQSDSKCIIIIGHKIPKKQIIEYIKSNMGEKIIIWLRSNLIYSSPIIEIDENRTELKLYILYYRRSFSILSFCFGRKYPTKMIISTIRSNILEIMRNYKSDKVK